MAIGILGGAFDPPHVGHVSLARAAMSELELEGLLVLVVAEPGHKPVATPAEIRLQLAKLAFEGVPRTTVELDHHARTVDSLEERRPEDAYFVLGSDELADFLRWKEPLRVLELVRLAVATRPGVPQEGLEEVRSSLAVPDRVVTFEMAPVPTSSSEVRERLRRGERVDELVPAKVADAIASLGLYAGAQ